MQAHMTHRRMEKIVEGWRKGYEMAAASAAAVALRKNEHGWLAKAR